MNLYQRSGSSNPIGKKLEMGWHLNYSAIIITRVKKVELLIRTGQLRNSVLHDCLTSYHVSRCDFSGRHSLKVTMVVPVMISYPGTPLL